MSKKDIWVSIGGHRCKFDDLSFDLQNRISVSYKDIYGESLLSEKKEVKNLDLELTKLENIVLKYKEKELKKSKKSKKKNCGLGIKIAKGLWNILK